MISLHYPIAILLFIVGIYCLLYKRNLIKMVIGLEILTDGVHLFLISIGFRKGGIPPIWSKGITNFASKAVDPIPQVLVLTSIVIDICIVGLALSLSIYIYRKYGTLNPSKLRELRE